MTRLVIWYIDIGNPFKIEVSTASKLDPQKLEQIRMKAQSLGNILWESGSWVHGNIPHNPPPNPRLNSVRNDQSIMTFSHNL